MKIIVKQHFNYFLPALSLFFVLSASAKVTKQDENKVLGKYVQNLQPSKPQLNFRNISGLNNSRVTAFWHDSYGYMWIGTLNGLHKFDGTNFKLYLGTKEENTPNSSRIDCLFEDSYGTLWVGNSEGICSYNRKQDSFIRYNINSDILKNPYPNSKGIKSIKEDAEGNIWIVSRSEGLLYYDDDLQEFEPYFNKSSEDSLTSMGFLTFDIDKYGFYWFGTLGNGVYRLDTKSRKIIHFNDDPSNKNKISGKRIEDILVDANNDIWVGTQNEGLHRIRYVEAGFNIKEYRHDPKNPMSLRNNSITSIFIDSQKRMWTCNNNGGLHLFDSASNGFYNYFPDIGNPKSVSSSSIWAVYEDRDKRLWVGTGLEGMDVSDPFYEKFEYFNASAKTEFGLTNDIVRGFHEDDNGNIWIATDGGGVNLFNRKNRSFESFHNDALNINSISADAVLSITSDTDGNLWIGTWAGGVNILDNKSLKFSKFLPSETKLDIVFQTITDKKGNIWFATYYGGLNKYDWKSKELITYWHDPDNPESIGDNRMYSLFEDSNENIWVGVRYLGLNLLTRDNIEKGVFKRFLHDENDPSSIASNTVNQIFEDSRNNIWIATTNGLNQYISETQSFELLDKKNGLNSNDIRSLVEDDNGMLWIRTMEGVSKYNPESKVVVNYTESDGVQKGSFLRHTMYKTKKGEILFAGAKGFNIFHPDSLSKSRPKPNVYFTDLKVFNKTVEVGNDTSVFQNHISKTKEIVLSNEHWKFTIEFVAINFTRPEKNQYAYIMEGLETNWNYVGEEHKATYTHLPAGEYMFKVKASNGGGVWNDEGASVLVTILPAWWQTWWAIVLYVTGFILTVVGLIKWRTKLYKLRQFQLEELIESRMMELREKNAEISEQAEELQTYNDALNVMNENLEKIVESRTAKIKLKNHELIKYSFENAHNVRGPLTRIMGLVNLVKANLNGDSAELLNKIEEASKEMDEITRAIGKKLDAQVDQMDKNFIPTNDSK